MLVSGRVMSVEGEYIVVELAAGYSCRGCDGHMLCGKKKADTQELRIPNTAGAQKGDTVSVKLCEPSLARISLLLYAVPVIFFFAGVIIGQAVFHSELMAVVLGFLFFAISLFLLHVTDRRWKSKEKLQMQVVEILTRHTS